jgi:hypothetical protein
MKICYEFKNINALSLCFTCVTHSLEQGPSRLSHACYMSRLFRCLYLSILIIFGEEYRLHHSSLRKFIHYTVGSYYSYMVYLTNQSVDQTVAYSPGSSVSVA